MKSKRKTDTLFSAEVLSSDQSQVGNNNNKNSKFKLFKKTNGSENTKGMRANKFNFFNEIQLNSTEINRATESEGEICSSTQFVKSSTGKHELYKAINDNIHHFKANELTEHTLKKAKSSDFPPDTRTVGESDTCRGLKDLGRREPDT